MIGLQIVINEETTIAAAQRVLRSLGIKVELVKLDSKGVTVRGTGRNHVWLVTKPSFSLALSQIIQSVRCELASGGIK